MPPQCISLKRVSKKRIALPPCRTLKACSAESTTTAAHNATLPLRPTLRQNKAMPSSPMTP